MTRTCDYRLLFQHKGRIIVMISVSPLKMFVLILIVIAAIVNFTIEAIKGEIITCPA